jgi:hypothetical protein
MKIQNKFIVSSASLLEDPENPLDFLAARFRR